MINNNNNNTNNPKNYTNNDNFLNSDFQTSNTQYSNISHFQNKFQNNHQLPNYTQRIWNDQILNNNQSYLDENHQQHYNFNNKIENNNDNNNTNNADSLISKLHNLSNSPNYNNFLNSINTSNGIPGSIFDENVFNLPIDLQGGVSNISSRRPSFAAEQTYTYNPSKSLGNFVHSNNLQQQQNQYQYQQSLQGQQSYDLMNNFKSRRPSIQINTQSIISSNNNILKNDELNLNSNINSYNDINNSNNSFELDNGLLLNVKTNKIITSTKLRIEFEKCSNYFSLESSEKLYQYLNDQLLTNLYLQKIVINLKKLNNLFNLSKNLILALTKSGKFEILSQSINSNLLLNKNDVIICDGDRGKDLVFILNPSISLDLAILINYLKKKLHSKSISYNLDKSIFNKRNDIDQISNTVDDLIKGFGILDEETQFQIPTKQVLRFANFQEIYNLKFKLIEEIKSLKTCILKISNNSDYKIRDNLFIKNSEYQFDQKKLIFYYYSIKNQRLDFRILIKELFKIYKTRIWLCAILNPINSDDTDNELISYNWLNNININDIDFANFKIDDFHVQNLLTVFNELLINSKQMI
ncbi:hypothetical protein WICMUC_000007 [Wickerhamomyces mucosus]|uniref:PSP1 C-terminal domain-containing protein n=1 Tax=Wickerhamomyces mucosus TaxID=1378264 RepID=A0A9P8PZ66_9ASCO|nr:hypothetical protein WICMUC_000007 [Wickerhamomyces mucosus]